eukprot:8748184-Alexandrium_andersonii.AAC.1
MVWHLPIEDLAHVDATEVVGSKSGFADSWAKLLGKTVGLRTRSQTIEFQAKSDARWAMVHGSLARKYASSKVADLRAQVQDFVAAGQLQPPT